MLTCVLCKIRKWFGEGKRGKGSLWTQGTPEGKLGFTEQKLSRHCHDKAVFCWSNLQTVWAYALSGSVRRVRDALWKVRHRRKWGGVGCTGSNCRPTEGVIKTRLEVKRGLESKYKNQYVTRIGERSQSACVVNADSMNSGWVGKGERGGRGRSCWTKL